MPHFVLRCIDGDLAEELRPFHRAAHVEHVRGTGVTRVAGPLLDDSGKTIGSMLIIEVEDLAAANAFSQADPFRSHGVFKSVEVTSFRMTYVDLSPETA